MRSIACLLLICGHAGAAPLDVYLLAGQSNMGGGMAANEVPPELADPQAIPYQFRLQNGAAYIDTTGWEQLRVLAPGYPGTNWGLELPFGATLQAHAPRQIAIIKVAANGTNLDEEWAPTIAGSWYHRTIEKVQQSLAQLADLDYQPTLAGAVWVQGEGDAGVLDRANRYGTNLLNLANGWRTAFNAPDMPFSFNQLHAQADRAFTGILRDQQAMAATQPNMHMVNLDDQSLGADKIHFTASMHVAAGERFAEVFFPTVPIPGDFNEDGAVDADDLDEWAGSYGEGLGGDEFLQWQRSIQPQTVNVPEPTAAALLVIAGAYASARIRIRRTISGCHTP